MVDSPDVSALTKSSCITLREITKDTVRAVSLLDVGPGQVGLVAPNAYSIAQTTFHREAWIRAVCADDVAVGFAMMKDYSISH